MRWPPPVALENGDVIWAQQQRPLDPKGLSLPATPVQRFTSYGQAFDWCRVADLPEKCADGWLLNRLPKGATKSMPERATVRLPGELRHVVRGGMPRPWFQTLFRAPDNAIWAVQYDVRLENGVTLAAYGRPGTPRPFRVQPCRRRRAAVQGNAGAGGAGGFHGRALTPGYPRLVRTVFGGGEVALEEDRLGRWGHMSA